MANITPIRFKGGWIFRDNPPGTDTKRHEESDMEKIRKKFCKHYDGREILLGKTRKCKDGVNVRELVGGEISGWMNRIPCCKANESDIVCELYQDYTQEEIDANDAWLNAHMERCKAIGPLCVIIRKKHPHGGCGEIECPVCGSVLDYGRASSNGHIHGQCRGDGCISWME